MCKHLYPTCHSSWIHPPGRNVFFRPAVPFRNHQGPGETPRSDRTKAVPHDVWWWLVIWLVVLTILKPPTGWWFEPSEKYEFVSWDDDIPIWTNKNVQTTNQWWLVMLTDGWGKNDSTGWMRCWTMSSWARITGDQSFVQKLETVSEHSCSQLQICHAYVGFTGQHRQEWMINGTSIHWMTTKNGPHLRSIET